VLAFAKTWFLARRITLIVCFAAACQIGVSEASSSIVLNSDCPSGFVKAQNLCELDYHALALNIRSALFGSDEHLKVDFRNGFSPYQIDLGRYLFFDPILSKSGAISCASCHMPSNAFSGPVKQLGGELLKGSTRSVPSLWNVGFSPRLFWDARAESLEHQLLNPLFSADEMANTPSGLLERFRASTEYMQLFKQAFPKEDEFKLKQLYTVLAAFQSSLISLRSRYDEFQSGHANRLSIIEQQGLALFTSIKTRCAECHQPPLFTNHSLAVIGAPELKGQPFDQGARLVFDSKALLGAFKVPSLRNIELTSPYMHSGVFNNLQSAVSFYNGGRGHAVSSDIPLNIHWHIWEPRLNQSEITSIVSFLRSLTDQSLLPQKPLVFPNR